MRTRAGSWSVNLRRMQGNPTHAGADSEAAQPPPLRRVGHKGADLIEPGNTPASFDAALASDVDMIELDVLRERGGGRLILAHDYEDAARREPLTLEDGLTHLASEQFESIEFIVDLKLPGYEREVVEGLMVRGLAERSLISSTYLSSLEALGRVHPGIRRGWSVPRAQRDYTKSVLALPAYGVLRWWRVRLPGRARANIARGACEAVMAHWRLVGRRLVRAVHGAGGQLYVWTVDDPERIAALEELGVDGVITNDPRLFRGDSVDLAESA